MELKSLTQQINCVGAESGCLSMLRECLVYSSMRLGVPFMAPRQLGAVGDNLGRQFLPSVEWCTGQSGAPPDSHCSCSVHDLLPNQAHLTVAPRARWRNGHCPVHTGQSGPPAERWSSPHVARRFRGRQLALATVGSPDSPVDSPVNYSHIAFSVSRERRFRRG
jgi:hypothetical protein